MPKPTYTLSDVHRRHGEVFARAALEPIAITKQGRPSYLILGAELAEKIFGSFSADKSRRAGKWSNDSVSTVFRAARKSLSTPVRISATLTRVAISEARRDFSAICNRVAFGKERVVIGRHGKKRVAVIPYEDLELLEELEDRLDLRAALAALKEAEKEGTVAWDELKAKLAGAAIIKGVHELYVRLMRTERDRRLGINTADTPAAPDEFARQMSLAEEGLSRYRQTLRALAE